VEDDGSISGVRRQDLETWIMDTVIAHYVHPMLTPTYDEVELDNQKKVAVISFEPGTSRPYVLRQHGGEDIYIRLGSTSRRAERDTQMRLYESGELIHVEEVAVSGTSLESLDQARLIDYITNIINDSEFPNSTTEWETRLKGLGLMIDGADGRCKCTVAGLVLFGIKPHKRLYQAGVRWMSFPGVDMDYKAEDDILLDGPLLPRGQGKFKEGRKIVEPGLIEKAVDRIMPFITEENDKIDDHFRREKHSFYPIEAIREAILNGFAHRDWTRSVELTITNYLDRIEINSPGALRNSMTVEKMLSGQRSVRNQIIVETLRDYEYVDMRGMGIRRKIVPLTKEFTGKDAQFEVTEDYVKVIIPAKDK
jgi:ATP-dependent DNA helicase RecG